MKTSNVFADRRRRFLEGMKDGVAIFRSAPVQVRNNDVDQPYRQDSDFFFLTGFEEPESYAVFQKAGDQARYILFVRPSDPEMEVWAGHRAGLAGAVRDFGADEAYGCGEFFDRLPGLLSNRPRLYLRFGQDPDLDARVGHVLEGLKAEARKGTFGPWEIVDPRTILWEMRLVKGVPELEALDRAASITVDAFKAAMRAVMPGMKEYELAAVVEFEFRRRGSPRVGFETICAAGANATTLHYIRNDAVIRDGDLVLIDAGAEFGYMSADVSRTFPASGKFTEPARTVYSWVLRAQEAAFLAIRPGATYAQVHEAALKVLCKALVEMGCVKGPARSVLEEGTYRPFFMHRIGHWLGSDVHDVGPYFVDGRSIPLRAGMVVTVEPGLYFATDAPVPPALRGIGVRIEDDVLVTDDGPRVLTDGVPKDPDAIEKFMKTPGSWWGSAAPVTMKKARRERKG